MIVWLLFVEKVHFISIYSQRSLENMLEENSQLIKLDLGSNFISSYILHLFHSIIPSVHSISVEEKQSNQTSQPDRF